jgi:hypothetical protein
VSVELVTQHSPSFLEFFNELLPVNGEALPESTYEAKKFLRDMGLGYEKILGVS